MKSKKNRIYFKSRKFGSKKQYRRRSHPVRRRSRPVSYKKNRYKKYKRISRKKRGGMNDTVKTLDKLKPTYEELYKEKMGKIDINWLHLIEHILNQFDFQKQLRKIINSYFEIIKMYQVIYIKLHQLKLFKDLAEKDPVYQYSPLLMGLNDLFQHQFIINLLKESKEKYLVYKEIYNKLGTDQQDYTFLELYKNKSDEYIIKEFIDACFIYTTLNFDTQFCIFSLKLEEAFKQVSDSSPLLDKYINLLIPNDFDVFMTKQGGVFELHLLAQFMLKFKSHIEGNLKFDKLIAQAKAKDKAVVEAEATVIPEIKIELNDNFIEKISEKSHTNYGDLKKLFNNDEETLLDYNNKIKTILDYPSSINSQKRKSDNIELAFKKLFPQPIKITEGLVLSFKPSTRVINNLTQAEPIDTDPIYSKILEESKNIVDNLNTCIEELNSIYLNSEFDEKDYNELKHSLLFVKCVCKNIPDELYVTSKAFKLKVRNNRTITGYLLYNKTSNEFKMYECEDKEIKICSQNKYEKLFKFNEKFPLKSEKIELITSFDLIEFDELVYKDYINLAELKKQNAKTISRRHSLPVMNTSLTTKNINISDELLNNSEA